ncbi:winged helix-turn-helix transcriptional regulator [Bradyrhizobium jicamae]|uniref:Winged helix-turn-helix transcriptional regulator n=1 Tax=Bradyrhizobium jicamae TaxID=280332 RepID=A0ABS5FEN6_9BRAD|nr:winged helix-turn-helix transcriptional regulator [Bradyrhizobium jicamae]MBR0795259.1 winged helix-turn-helix transcriptional regulator [Bradyrhizobium jicamae]
MPAKPWSREDEKQLLRLLRKPHLTQREIAQKIGRTEAAVSGRLMIIRKRTKASADRRPPFEAS